MILQTRWIRITALIFCVTILSATGIMSKEYDFLPIDTSKVSSFDTDRVVFQRIEYFSDLSRDNSVELLLVIKNRKMFMLMDGYDSALDAKSRKFIADSRNMYAEKIEDLVWKNKINGKPDFIQIMDRRVPIMMNANEEYVSMNFGVFYKSIRDKFITEHVEKYRQILRNRKDSDINIERKRIPRSMAETNSDDFKEKFFTSVKVRAMDDTVYTCEDADGDGITETFIATMRDGYNWGYKSGPNLIFILKNTDKDIETLIGKLTNEAMYGSVEDEKMMIETFPKEKDITELLKWLTPKDPNSK